MRSVLPLIFSSALLLSCGDGSSDSTSEQTVFSYSYDIVEGTPTVTNSEVSGSVRSVSVAL